MPLLSFIALKFAILSVVLGTIAAAVPPVLPQFLANATTWGEYEEMVWSGGDEESPLGCLYNFTDGAYSHITVDGVRNMITFSDSSANWPLTCLDALCGGMYEFPISEIK